MSYEKSVLILPRYEISTISNSQGSRQDAHAWIDYILLQRNVISIAWVIVGYNVNGLSRASYQVTDI